MSEEYDLELMDTLGGIASRVDDALAKEYLRGFAAGINHERGIDFISDKLVDVEIEGD